MHFSKILRTLTNQLMSCKELTAANTHPSNDKFEELGGKMTSRFWLIFTRGTYQKVKGKEQLIWIPTHREGDREDGKFQDLSPRI